MKAENKANGEVTQTQTPVEVKIPPVQFQILTVEIRGITPLIVHKWSEKALKQMQAKQGKVAQQKREAKVPEEEAKAALYVISEGVYGFPADGIKKAMVNACRHVDGIPMTFARGAFHVYGDARVGGRDLVRLVTPGWKMRMDPVRNDNGGADLRYRPQFDEWSCKVRLRYIKTSIAAAQIINLLQVAGFACGLGENRAEKSGETWGQFEIVAEVEKN